MSPPPFNYTTHALINRKSEREREKRKEIIKMKKYLRKMYANGVKNI
jgi:hypothetical protein